MKNFNFDDPEFIIKFYFSIIGIVFGGVLAWNVGKVIITQQALNQECGTKYNLVQVALAGENLSRICQIKNQTPNLK